MSVYFDNLLQDHTLLNKQNVCITNTYFSMRNLDKTQTRDRPNDELLQFPTRRTVTNNNSFHVESIRL